MKPAKNTNEVVPSRVPPPRPAVCSSSPGFYLGSCPPPSMKRLSGVRSSLRLFNIAVDGNLVLHEIQRSVDLANTCYRDLQRLIALRNEHLRLLESHDVGLLRRVDEAIARARRSVTDACRIVERFRPGVQHGNSTRTPLHMRIEWLTSNSSEFHKLEPVIRQHHAEVLAELDSLRAVASRPLPSESRKHIEATRHIAGPAEKEVFDNLALLGDIIGDGFAGILSALDLAQQQAAAN